MRKTIVLLALGLFLSASVAANACDKDKACSMKSSKVKSACCMKGAKATKTADCTMKDAKDCTKDPKCVKEMKASKDMKNCCKKVVEKQS